MDLVETTTSTCNYEKSEWFISNIRMIEASLYRIAFTILKNTSDSEDALSEAILKGYKYRYKLKDENAFKSWMSKILIREAYKILKKNKRIVSIPLGEYEEVTNEDGLQGELIEIIKTLPADLATALTLFYYDKYIQEQANKEEVIIPLHTKQVINKTFLKLQEKGAKKRILSFKKKMLIVVVAGIATLSSALIATELPSQIINSIKDFFE